MRIASLDSHAGRIRKRDRFLWHQDCGRFEKLSTSRSRLCSFSLPLLETVIEPKMEGLTTPDQILEGLTMSHKQGPLMSCRS